ncbi:hypothetical protein Ocin01_01447, partial [Orchesella cincta]
DYVVLLPEVKTTREPCECTVKHDSLLSSLNENGTESELRLTSWELDLVSKVVFILYFGEALVSKEEQRKLQPILKLFQIKSTKRQLLSQKVTRANPNAPIRLAELRKRKVLAARKTNEKEVEAVYIYGDGSEMDVPVQESDGSFSGNAVIYDEEGTISCDSLRQFCRPCSMIFCDQSDYISHMVECGHKQLFSPPKAIKIELEFIKAEAIDNDYTENISELDPIIISPVTPVEEASELSGSIIKISLCTAITCMAYLQTRIMIWEPGNANGAIQLKNLANCQFFFNTFFIVKSFPCGMDLQEGTKISRKRARSNTEENFSVVSNQSQKRKRRKTSGRHSETNGVEHTSPDAEESNSLPRLVISNVSTIEPGTSLKICVDQNDPEDAIKCKSSTDTEGNRDPEEASQKAHETSVNSEAKISQTPLQAFKIPKLKTSNQNSVAVDSCSASTVQDSVSNGEEVSQSLVRSPGTFTAAFNSSSPHLIKKQQRHEQSPAKSNNANGIQNQISNSPPNVKIIRAPGLQRPSSTTLLNIFNTVTNIQSQVDNLSYTMNTKSNHHIQRQFSGLPVKWTKKKSLFKKFGPKVQLTAWSCRRCSKSFTTQRLYMYHSC